MAREQLIESKSPEKLNRLESDASDLALYADHVLSGVEAYDERKVDFLFRQASPDSKRQIVMASLLSAVRFDLAAQQSDDPSVDTERALFLTKLTTTLLKNGSKNRASNSFKFYRSTIKSTLDRLDGAQDSIYQLRFPHPLDDSHSVCVNPDEVRASLVRCLSDATTAPTVPGQPKSYLSESDVEAIVAHRSIDLKGLLIEHRRGVQRAVAISTLAGIGITGLGTTAHANEVSSPLTQSEYAGTIPVSSSVDVSLQAQEYDLSSINSDTEVAQVLPDVEVMSVSDSSDKLDEFFSDIPEAESLPESTEVGPKDEGPSEAKKYLDDFFGSMPEASTGSSDQTSTEQLEQGLGEMPVIPKSNPDDQQPTSNSGPESSPGENAELSIEEARFKVVEQEVKDLLALERWPRYDHPIDPNEYLRYLKAADEKYSHPLVTDTVVLALNWQESKLDLRVKSHAGALGIGQFMPDTARGFGIDPYNPEQAIDATFQYLIGSIDQINSDPRFMNLSSGEKIGLALASYNAGMGAVNQYNGVPPFDETQTYVSTINNHIKALYDLQDAAGAATRGGGEGEMNTVSAPNALPQASELPPENPEKSNEAGWYWPTVAEIDARPDYPGHYGKDFETLTGTSVYAMRAGKVIAAGIDPGMDAPTCTALSNGHGVYNGPQYHIVLEHTVKGDDGVEKKIYTEYAHLEPGSFDLKVNDFVSGGQELAKSGNSGCTGGQHLHVGAYSNYAGILGTKAEDVIDPAVLIGYKGY